MTIVVKIGGEASESPGLRFELARQMAWVRRSRHRLIAVHGGGKLLTQTLARLGIPTAFRGGLRVTDSATRDAAVMVLAGLLNKTWVSVLESVRQPALGLCGGDGGLVRAERFRAPQRDRRAQLGLVGRPARIHTTILDVAYRAGIIPVVASVAPDGQGEYLNLNADDLAASLATALRADRLVFLTGSGGVHDGSGRVLQEIGAAEVRRLIAQGVARNGMIPKLRAAARLVAHGVCQIDIASPEEPRILCRIASGEKYPGTRITAAPRGSARPRS